VPVMKDDDFIQDSMYRNNIDVDDDDPPPHVFDPLPPPPAPITFAVFLVGIYLDFNVYKKWLQTNLIGTCPQCKVSCSSEDVRPLYATPLSIPAADKGVADPEIKRGLRARAMHRAPSLAKSMLLRLRRVF
ncbi:hypothetical protein Tco_0761144, partial [Tanacetum coccineum]